VCVYIFFRNFKINQFLVCAKPFVVLFSVNKVKTLEGCGVELAGCFLLDHRLCNVFTCLVLRSEIPSGMCAKLRTVAASNNRDHLTRSLYYCLFAPHTYIFVLRTHPVCGESHNQRNTNGEVATLDSSHISCTHCASRKSTVPIYKVVNSFLTTS